MANELRIVGRHPSSREEQTSETVNSHGPWTINHQQPTTVNNRDFDRLKGRVQDYIPIQKQGWATGNDYRK